MYSAIMDSLGTKILVLISEVSLFQGQNGMYLYEVGTWSSVLINQGVLISEVISPRLTSRLIPVHN